MPRTNTSKQQTTGKTTRRSEAELAETVEATSQGKTTASPASKKKAAGNGSTQSAASKKKAPAPDVPKYGGAEKKPKYGRAEALIDALRQGPGTRDEIAERSDQLYVDHGGGTSSIKGARAQIDVTLSTLKAAGVVTEDEDKRLSFTK